MTGPSAAHNQLGRSLAQSEMTWPPGHGTGVLGLPGRGGLPCRRALPVYSNPETRGTVRGRRRLDLPSCILCPTRSTPPCSPTPEIAALFSNRGEPGWVLRLQAR